METNTKQSQTRLILTIFFVWQIVSVYLMVIGVWPAWVAWVTVGVSAIYIFFSSPYTSLLLLILSLPLYVALPSPISDSLPMWRPLAVILGARWLYDEIRVSFPGLVAAARSRSILLFLRKKILDNFFGWEKYLGLFVLIALVSLLFARYRIQGLKQVIYLLNVYILYVVCVYVVKDRAQIIQLIRYLATSLGVIVLLGYVQFTATFFTTIYDFWQYWATMVSKIYYGESLSQVLAYSNSWFTPTDPKTLRMFSVMPDSHSFAMICVLLIACALTLLYAAEQPNKFFSSPRGYWKHRIAYALWSVIRFSGLAVIFSGTRGMWVGLIPPFFVSAYLYIKNIGRAMVRRILLSFVLIVFLFAIAPVINMGLNAVRFHGYKEDFLQRAATIYKIKEQSNLGFVQIWESSLRYAAHHPLGVGYGNFIVSLIRETPRGTKFREIAVEKNFRYNLPQRYVSAHSLYLHILVELSIVGLVVFLAFWVQYYLTVWSFLKTHRNDANPLIFFVLNIAVTFIWFLAYSIFDITLFNDKVLVYSLICLALSGIIIKNYNRF